MNRKFIGLLLCACSVAAHAGPPPSPPRFHVLRTGDGLPSNMPQAIVQDHDGFIWVGMRHGLARYDGTGFRHWLHDPRDAHSLPDNDVTALLVDRNGRLWCGTEGGGVSLMQADGRFRHFRHVPGDGHSLGSDDVLALAEDVDGAIWVGTYLGGVARIDARGSVARFEHSLDDAAGLRSNFVIALIVDARGRLWIGTDKGLDVRLPDGRFVAVDLPAVGAKKSPAKLIAGFLAESDGSMLVGMRDGIVRVRADLGVEGVVGAPLNGTVQALVREPGGRLWAATPQGLLRADGDRWEMFGAGETAQGDVPGTRVQDALRDRDGNLWFAFVDGGLARLPPQPERFSVWQHRRGTTASLTHTRVGGVAVDPSGGAWTIADSDGLDHVGADGTVTRHGGRIPGETALRSVAVADGRVWIGRWRGILRYDPASGVVRELRAGRTVDALADAPVVRLIVGSDGMLWAAARGGGISRIDPHTLGVRTWAPQFGTLGDADTSSLQIDREGRPWVVGGSGFERYDPGADRFVAVSGPMNPAVEAFALAADGSLWLHRLGGLEHHRLEEGSLTRIERIDVDDGWPSMEVRDMHVDDHGDLWAAGFEGLWRIDPSTRQLRMYGEQDGLPSREFGGLLAATADTIYAPTLGGLVAFDPRALSARAPAPPVRITALSVRRAGEVIALDPRSREIDLRHDDRDLRVEARALSFLGTGALRFAFRLHPDESRWIDGGKAGERVFSQLPTGRHALSVRVDNADGETSELALPLGLRVAPAPWLHPLAWLGYSGLLALALWFALRVQHRRVEERHALALAGEQRRQAERLGAAKSAFLATMSHEMRTPMTSLLGMTELLQHTALDARQRGYLEAIANSGGLLLRLVNDSLDLARIEAGKLALEPRAFDPAALVDEVAALARPLAVQRGLALRVTRAADVPRAVLGDRLRIEQVLLNLVGNAVKFTEHGGVDVDFTRAADGRLAFAVADTGPGMSADFLERLFGRFEQSAGTRQRHGGSGLGLAIARELVDLMGGNIAVDSVPGRGSRFVVELPLAEVGPDRLVAEARPHVDVTSRDGLDVLVVEDDASVASVLVELLELLGHRARSAADALAALAELEHATVDVALVDFDLPGIDGLALAGLLRQRERTSRRRLALVGISARALGNEAEQARHAGMDGFVRKPVTAAMLADALAPFARGEG
ncbi:MAG: response regulator [Xanthomonadales bacterium]|nr:response regulator [Xanthomonadales bacterium]